MFFAQADQATTRRWFAEGEGWNIHEYRLDFRVDGLEYSRFQFGDGPEITLHSVVQEIVRDRRIVFAYRMTIGGNPLSVSLGTVELTPTNGGRLMTYTEAGHLSGQTRFGEGPRGRIARPAGDPGARTRVGLTPARPGGSACRS